VQFRGPLLLKKILGKFFAYYGSLKLHLFKCICFPFRRFLLVNWMAASLIKRSRKLNDLKLSVFLFLIYLLLVLAYLAHRSGPVRFRSTGLTGNLDRVWPVQVSRSSRSKFWPVWPTESDRLKSVRFRYRSDQPDRLPTLLIIIY
jgi:hypothetical protein